MWIRAGGGVGQPMLIIFKFYNINIKSAKLIKYSRTVQYLGETQEVVHFHLNIP